MDNINEATKEIHQKWLQKPFGFQFHLDNPQEAGLEFFSPEKGTINGWDVDKPTPVIVRNAIESLETEICDRSKKPYRGFFAITGQKNCCKSLVTQSLIQSLRKKNCFEKFFYWNAHYSDDIASLFDYLTVFFTGKSDPISDPETMFERWLSENRSFIVFDGVERVFDNSNRLKGVIDAVCNPLNQSCVLMVGRTIPAAVKNKCQYSFEMQPMNAAEMEASKILPKSCDFDLITQCTEGRWFAAYLLQYMISIPGKKKSYNIGYISDLIRRQSVRAPKERMGLLIQDAFDRLNADFKMQFQSSTNSPNDEINIEKYVRKIGSYLRPLYKEQMHDILGRSRDNEDEEFKFVFKKMFDNKMLVTLTYPCDSRLKEESLYSLRPSMKEHFYGSPDYRTQGAEPTLDLGGALSNLQPVYPQKEDESMIRDMFLKWREQAISPEGEKPTKEIRAMFSLIRTRMNAIGAARSDNFGGYVSFGIQLLALCKMDYNRWNLKFSGTMKDILCKEAPLFCADLAWIYNDVAFALLLEGHAHDALEIWEQCLSFSRLLEKGHPGRLRFTLQPLVSLGLGCIDIGLLSHGESFLNEAWSLNIDKKSNKNGKETEVSYKDEMIQGKIRAFSGVIEHMRANYQTAHLHYEEAIKVFNSRVKNNRGLAVVYRYQSSLYRVQGRRKKARRALDNAVASAHTGGHEDLLFFAEIDEARLNMDEEPIAARRILHSVVVKAQKRGFQKIEGMALRVLAQVNLKQGDADGARRQVIDALRIFNGLSLSLRTTRCMCILAESLMLSNQNRKLAKAYLKVAVERAERQQYYACKRDAEQMLRDLE